MIYPRLTTLVGLLVATAALLVPVACSPDASRSSDAEPTVWSVAETPLATIGVADGAPEYLFQQVRGVRLLRDGRLAVADGGSSTIRLFAEDGGFLHQMGARGEGPGEFGYIQSLRVVPRDTLEVYDSANQRLTRFLADGTLVSTLTFIAGEGAPEMYIGSLPDGHHVFAWTLRRPIAPGGVARSMADSMRLGWFGPDGRFRNAFHTTTGIRRLGSPVPFSPYPHGVLVEDRIVYTDGLRPELTVFDAGGRTVRTLPVPVEPADPASAWAALEAELRAGAETGIAARMGWTLEQLEPITDRELMPHIAEVLRDDGDRLWVKRYDPATDNFWTGTPGGTGGEWLVLGPDGDVVATIELPEGLVLEDVRGDRLVGVSRDELDVERVVVYEISG